jgi:DNA-binding response OmpR family regulator
VVVIVEDDRPIADYVAAVVADAGYHPVVATHGRQALDMIEAQRPALILTDLMLPFLSGAEVIAAVRAHPNPVRARVPVIVMTAAHRKAAQLEGADAILRKPFSIDELQSLLRRFLEADGAEGAAPAAAQE